MYEIFFLSKNGKVYGPFDSSQRVKMQQQAEWSTFGWIINDPTIGWECLWEKPIEIPPFHGKKTPHKPLALTALCHNYKHALSGKIVSFSSTECIFQPYRPWKRVQPHFMPGEKLVLNLLHTETHVSESLQVQLLTYKREKNVWFYTCAWHSVPQCLKAAAQ